MYCVCEGTCFVRTDQLDGETDWKMRVAVPQTQELSQDMVSVYVHMYVHTYIHTYSTCV